MHWSRPPALGQLGGWVVSWLGGHCPGSQVVGWAVGRTGGWSVSWLGGQPVGWLGDCAVGRAEKDLGELGSR